MASNEEQIIYKLDLDSDAFIKSINQVNEKLGSIEKTTKSADPAIMFANAVIAVEAFKIAVDLAGKAMDIAFAGENVKAINFQFELLAKNAGIASNKLKEGLTEAAAGLIDDTDLLQIANKSIVAMGESASRLPEIMNLARKATSAFGGELSQNFELLSQAIQNGNTKMLKQLGLNVDAEKAQRDYARTLGVTVDSLSDAGKKQAIMNAVLEKGQKAFAGINSDLRASQNLWQEIKVTFGQIKEVAELLFEKTLGPGLRNYLSGVRELGSVIKENFVARFGEGKEQAEASINLTVQKIQELKASLIDLRAEGESSWWEKTFFFKDNAKDISEVESEIQKLEATLQKSKATVQEIKSTEVKSDSAVQGKSDSGVDKEKQLQSQTKFEADLLALKKARVNQELEVVTSAEREKALVIEQYEILATERDVKNKQIDDEVRLGTIANAQQAAELKLEIERNYQAQVQAMRMQEADMQARVYDNQVKTAQSTSQGVAAAWGQANNKATRDLNDFGARGQRVFNSLAGESKKAFIAMGEGSKTGAEIMKGFIFGMLADQAEAEGNLHLLKGIASYNPAEIAAGGALLALSGVLRSKAGGGASGGGAAGGAGGGGGIQSPFGEQGTQAQEFSQPKKAVTIQVQGNYFETEQTKQKLMEMIRSETDATDFKYVQIGGK